MTWNQAHTRYHNLLDELSYITWLWRISKNSRDAAFEQLLIDWQHRVQAEIDQLKADWYAQAVYA